VNSVTAQWMALRFFARANSFSRPVGIRGISSDDPGTASQAIKVA